MADLKRRLLEGFKPQEAALQLLVTIPGIDRVAAARLLVEIGDDMAAFGRADRLAKWAGMCPGNHAYPVRCQKAYGVLAWVYGSARLSDDASRIPVRVPG